MLSWKSLFLLITLPHACCAPSEGWNYSGTQRGIRCWRLKKPLLHTWVHFKVSVGGKCLDGNFHCISAWMEQKHVREARLCIFMNSCGKVSYNRHKLRKWIKFWALWCLCETRTAVWTSLITQNWYLLIRRQLAATTIHLWDTHRHPCTFYLCEDLHGTNALPLLTS